MVTNLFRVEEAARLLDISKSLVYQLVRSGELRAVRIKTAIRFRKEDIDNFIENNLSQRKGLVIDPSNHNVVSGQVER